MTAEKEHRENSLDPILNEIIQKSAKYNSSDDLDRLVDRVKDSDYILMGEATHGTSEFYRTRSTVTKKLIEEEKIQFIAVEGDWPDCYKINQYVKHKTDKTGFEVLSGIDRWPTWMWANWEVLEFIEWLREYNEGKDARDMVGFFGLDLYSLNESMEAVIDYLDKIDPEGAEEAKNAYKCFEPYTEGADYAQKIEMAPENCRPEVESILAQLIENKYKYEELEGDDYFTAEQNALIAKNAESYYRALVEADSNSWNIRDRHMAETLDRLMSGYGAAAKSVVWAHNSHVGDSRATNMEIRGRLNLGKLVRERHGDETSIIGFSTYKGAVVASDHWGGPIKEKNLPGAEEGSYDYLLHEASPQDKIVHLEDTEGLEAERGHRAVGVIYHPDNEKSNYVPTRLSRRYDHLVFIDESTPVHPIKNESEEAEEPETYPWGV